MAWLRHYFWIERAKDRGLDDRQLRYLSGYQIFTSVFAGIDAGTAKRVYKHIVAVHSIYGVSGIADPPPTSPLPIVSVRSHISALLSHFNTHQNHINKLSKCGTPETKQLVKEEINYNQNFSIWLDSFHLRTIQSCAFKKITVWFQQQPKVHMYSAGCNYQRKRVLSLIMKTAFTIPVSRFYNMYILIQSQTSSVFMLHAHAT